MLIIVWARCIRLAHLQPLRVMAEEWECGGGGIGQVMVVVVEREGGREWASSLVVVVRRGRDELATRLCALSYTAANTMLSTNISVLIRHCSAMVYCSK